MQCAKLSYPDVLSKIILVPLKFQTFHSLSYTYCILRCIHDQICWREFFPIGSKWTTHTSVCPNIL